MLIIKFAVKGVFSKYIRFTLVSGPPSVKNFIRTIPPPADRLGYFVSRTRGSDRTKVERYVPTMRGVGIAIVVDGTSSSNRRGGNSRSHAFCCPVFVRRVRSRNDYRNRISQSYAHVSNARSLIETSWLLWLSLVALLR